MSDEIRQRGRKLIADVVSDIKSRRETLSKLKQMTQIAKEIDPEFDVSDIEEMIDVSENVAEQITKRLDKTAKET